MTLRERFEKLVGPVTRSGCRLWTGARLRSRYGRVWHNGKARFAHRVAWELAHGPIPEGLCVLHRCDVPGCVAVGHLFLGTFTDNNRDCAAKGRRANQKKTRCLNGHPLSGANLYTFPDGRRCCKTCRRAAQARSRSKKTTVQEAL